MRTLLALVIVSTAFAGCISDEPEPTQATASDLAGFGVTDVQAEAAAWGYAVVDATEDGDVAGLTFTVTEEALAAARAESDKLFLQITPLLPATAVLEKYAVLVFDAGYRVEAEAANIAAQGQATVESAREQATSSGSTAKLIAAELFTALEGSSQQVAASAQASAAVGAGPVSIELPADVAVGDVFGVVLGMQTHVEAALSGAQQALDAADDAGAAAGDALDLRGKAAVLISLTGKAQAGLPSAADALEQAQALADKGRGLVLPVLGQAKGFAIPAFSFTVDGRTGERLLLASADIQATVQTTATGFWPILSTETVSLDVAREAASGFGSHLGGVMGDLGRLEYELVADVHGQAAGLRDAGVNAVGASRAAANYAVSASGLGGTSLSFDVTTQGRDLSGALWAAGVEFDAPLEVLLAQESLPISDLASAGLPIGTATGIRIDGPLGAWTLHY